MNLPSIGVIDAKPCCYWW